MESVTWTLDTYFLRAENPAPRTPAPGAQTAAASLLSPLAQCFSPRVPAACAPVLPPSVPGNPGVQWLQQWSPGVGVGMGLVPPAAHVVPSPPLLLNARASGPCANTPLHARDTLMRAISDPTALLRPAGS